MHPAFLAALPPFLFSSIASRHCRILAALPHALQTAALPRAFHTCVHQIIIAQVGCFDLLALLVVLVLPCCACAALLALLIACFASLAVLALVSAN